MKKITLLLLFLTGFTTQLFSQISGIVYRDYNNNGSRQSTYPSIEPGVPGVLIKAYNASNVLLNSTESQADGTYSLPFSEPVRIEFEIPISTNCLSNSLDFTSTNIDGNNVRFLTTSTSGINYGINYIEDFQSNTNPTLYVPHYTNGNPLGGGTAGQGSAIDGFQYNTTGTAAPSINLSSSSIGAVWGNVYSKQAKKIFTSAFIKRHVGLGPMGSGGIYMLTPNGNTFAVSNFFDFDNPGYSGLYRTRAGAGAPVYGNGSSFSINGTGNIITFLGAIDNNSGLPIGHGVVGDNGASGRNLPSDKTLENNDPSAFDQVGKVGLGGMDISDNGEFLFIMNLYDKKLYRLQLNNAYNPTSVINVVSYSLPTIAVSNGVLRGFAVKYYRNKVYIGAVSTGENNGTNTVGGLTDMYSYVFELNSPIGSATFTSTPILTLPLNYSKGPALATFGTKWYPWTNNTKILLTPAYGESIYPTPLLSAIDFTDRGDMILNFTDRSGHQWGYFNYRDLTGTTLVNFDIGGDILIAGKNCNTGNYTLENAGAYNSNGTIFTGSPSNLHGPGGGEFFSKDSFPVYHFETSQGSMALMRGANEGVFTLMDPINEFSGGTGHFSFTNGARSLEYQLYQNTVSNGDFSKANGLGDIEIAGDEPSIEIGNRIWNDANSNGIQDPLELGLANVTFELFADFNNDGTPDGGALASSISDANGIYAFNNSNVLDGDPTQSGNQIGLQPGKIYIIRIGTVDWSGGFGVADLNNFMLTQQNIGGAGQADVRDNDATMISGIPTIIVNTQSLGQHNQNYDFGFRSCLNDAGNSTSLSCTTPSGQLGSTAVAGFTYAWSPIVGLNNGSIAQPIANPLNTTIYTLTVNGSCISLVNVNVNKTNPTANAGSNVSLTCTTPNATIGTTAVAGNTYAWSPATALDNATIAQPTTSATTATTYSVTVTGSNGCTATSSVIVGVNKTNPTANAGTNVSLTCTTPNATIGTTAVAGNTYAWSPATALNNTTIAQPTSSATTATTYTVTVTGSNGCTATSSVIVGVNKTNPTANAGPSVSLTCTTPNATIGTTAVVGNTYAWSPATALDNATIAQPTTSATTATTYSVTVTGSNGCTATSSVIVGVNKTNPTANAGSNVSLTCTTPNATIGTTAVAGNTYAWSPATALDNTTIAQPTSSATIATTYSVTVTGSNGCTATSSVIVGLNKTNPILNTILNDTICVGESIVLSASGATSINWSENGNQYSNGTQVSPSVNTIYTVTGTNANGCSTTSSLTVKVNPLPLVNVSATPQIICKGNSSQLEATGGLTYTWNNGVLNSNQIVVPDSTTNYIITISDGNCSNSAIIQVVVNNLSTSISASTSTSSNIQTDGTQLTYTDSNCSQLLVINDSLGGNSLGITNAQVFIEPTTQMLLGRPFAKRWYEITPTNNGPAQLTLYFTQAEFDDYNLNNNSYVNMPLSGNNSDPNIGNVRITKVSGGVLGVGVETLITPNLTWNGNYWEASFSVTEFSKFYLHTADQNTALPSREFAAISAIILDPNHCNVNWFTVEEYNTKEFSIERSLNGVDFNSVSKINSSINTSTRTDYRITDDIQSIEENVVIYYRIRMIDIDGKELISNTVTTRKKSNIEEVVNFYPCPFNSQLNVEYQSSEETSLSIQLSDISGRVVYSKNADIVKGNNKIQLNELSVLSASNYFIRIVDLNTGESFVKKLVKQ